jgi:hypothetical protein
MAAAFEIFPISVARGREPLLRCDHAADLKAPLIPTISPHQATAVIAAANLPVVHPGGITRPADKQSNADFIEVSCAFRSVP